MKKINELKNNHAGIKHRNYFLLIIQNPSQMKIPSALLFPALSYHLKNKLSCRIYL